MITMAEIIRFRGRKREIAERFLRNETPADIALAVGTTAAYVYNVASELRKRGIQPRPPRIAPPQEIRHPARPHAEPRANPQAPPIPIRDEGGPSPRVRAKMDELSQLQQALRSMQQEEQVDVLIRETQLQTAIVHVCPNPGDVFAKQAVYTPAISLILNTMMPTVIVSAST